MSNIRIQLDKASKLFAAGKHAQAIDLYSAVIATDPEEPTAYRERARCHYRMGQLDEALADLSRAIELAPSPGTYFTRGRYCLEASRFHDACADFSNVLELERGREERPFFEAAAFFRAEAHVNLGRFEEALRDCMEIREDFSLYVLGRMRTRNEIIENAKAGLQKARPQ